MMDSTHSVRLCLLGVGILASLALILSLVGHGEYLLDASTYHFGLWRYCVASVCTNIDNVLSGSQQAKFHASRVFLCASHLVYVLNIVAVAVDILGAIKSSVGHYIVLFTSILAFVFLVVCMSLLTDITVDNLDSDSTAEADWSFIVPWTGAGFGLLEILTAALTLVIAK